MATRKARTALTVLGVILGVAVILATSIANESTIDAFRDTIDSITGKADFWVEGASAVGFKADRLQVVQKLAGVQTAVPAISKSSTLFGHGRRQTVRVAGVDPHVDRQVRQFNLTTGRWLKSGEFGILVTDRLAREKNLKPGSRISLAGKTKRYKFKVAGVLKDEGAGRFSGGRVVFIPLASAQEIFDMPDRLTFIDVKVAPGRRVGPVVAETKRRLGKSYIVERPEKRVEAISQMLRGLRIGLSFFGTIAMFVGGFLVLNTFTMVVVEQTKELGILRSVGAGRKQIAGMVLLQAAILGIIGSVIGVGAGMVLSKLLLSYVSGTVEMAVESISIPLSGLFTAMAVGLLVTLAGALQPALIAGRTSPLAAIRAGVRQSSKRLARLRVAFGLFGIAVGVAASFAPGTEGLGRYAWLAVPIHEGGNFMLLLGAALLSPTLAGPLAYILAFPIRVLFGETGKVASSNLTRNRGRTAATASAVMITVAMLMSVGGMTTSFRRSVDRWVNKTLGADVFVSGRSNEITFDKKFASRLRRTEGVKYMTINRFLMVREGNRQTTWRAIDAKNYRRVSSLQFTAGRPGRAWADLRRGDHVFISTVMAHKRNLKVGDRVKLVTVKGSKSFKISGVIVDFGGDMGDIIIGSRTDTKKYFNVDDAGGFRIKVANGVSPAVVARRIKKKFKHRDLDVQDIQEFKTMVYGRVDSSFAVFNVLILLAAIVAVISVFNTLMMNILERRREIGVLRAVGATRGQIALINIIEAFITGAIGAVLGLAVGGFSATDIVNAMNQITGYDISYVFPVRITVAALVLALVFSVLAAVYPARRAATLEIGQALRYE